MIWAVVVWIAVGLAVAALGQGEAHYRGKHAVWSVQLAIVLLGPIVLLVALMLSAFCGPPEEVGREQLIASKPE